MQRRQSQGFVSPGTATDAVTLFSLEKPMTFLDMTKINIIRVSPPWMVSPGRSALPRIPSGVAAILAPSMNVLT